jgi:hypothetical protein
MEKPILFSGEMVRAIIDGRKTKTRRVCKHQHWSFSETHDVNVNGIVNKVDRSVSSPFGGVGDKLWVRETFTEWNGHIQYRASTAHGEELGKWKSSIHMPKKAARIWLEIVSVRVERLNDISEDDAIMEGVRKYHNTEFYVRYGTDNDWCASAYASFSYLWESINGVNSWNANPWVWVIEFKRIDNTI